MHTTLVNFEVLAVPGGVSLVGSMLDHLAQHLYLRARSSQCFRLPSITTITVTRRILHLEDTMLISSTSAP